MGTGSFSISFKLNKLNCRIRKIILSILSLAFLISATELHELFRLPQLFAHFKDHCQEDPSMDLGQYIQLHYISTHPNDQDEEEDSELPFKETQVNHVDLVEVPMMMNLAVFISPEVVTIPCRIGIPLIQAYSIFRPPQAV